MKKLYEESSLQAIADAIRKKNRAQQRYTAASMPGAIDAIRVEDADLILDVRNASTTGENLGGHIATGVNLGDYSEWTLFIDVDLSDYVYDTDFKPRLVHSMWEESPYPGFTFDLNVTAKSKYNPRIAIGKSEIYTLKNNADQYDHAVYVITCRKGSITVYDDAHPAGIVLGTKYNTIGYQALLTIGAKAEITGIYTRMIALKRIDLKVFKRILTAEEVQDCLSLVHLISPS